MNNIEENMSKNTQANKKNKTAHGRKGGFFRFIFGDMYVYCNEKWKQGFFYKLFRKRKQKIRKRPKIAQLYEQSIVCRIISALSNMVIHAQVRMIGVAILMYAFAIVIAAFAQEYFLGELNPINIVVGAVIAALSIPFIASKKQFGEALLTGRISSYVVLQVLAIEETRLERKEKGNGDIGYSYLFLFAILLGLSTYFISPFVYINLAMMIITFVTIMCFPELGIMSVIGIIPFSNMFENPTMAVLFIVGTSALGFTSKFIRGKRVLRFELMDIFVLAFGALIFFGGIFSRGGTPSMHSAFMYCAFLSVYFVIVNIYIRKTWLYRGINLIVFTTSLVALLGIIEGGVINASWMDASVFESVRERITAFLDNPNMLGVYLVIVFPYAFARIFNARSTFSKVMAILATLIIFVCTVMTWSRGAWLGIIVATIVFLLVCNKKNIWFVFAGAASVPLWAIILPDSIVLRFESILTMADSSVTYRFSTWKGVWNMICDNLLRGIGVGESAFKEVYPSYAVSGTESVMHSHNLFLQIALEVGIFGLIVFAIILFMYMQRTFYAVRFRNHDSKSRVMIAAGFAGIVGAAVSGLTDHIWYNYRVFLIFWIVLALTMSFVKIDQKERLKENAGSASNIRSADIDIYF